MTAELVGPGGTVDVSDRPSRLVGNVTTTNVLVPVDYDHVGLTYSGGDLVGVTYKVGGAGGATVAQLSLAYSGGQLASVERT